VAPTLTCLPVVKPPAGGLRVQADLTAGRVVLIGDLDRATFGRVVAACRLLTAVGHPIWVLDLAGVSFCDASGLRSLAMARYDAEAVGATLVLAGARPLLRRLLSNRGLGGVLTPIARTSAWPAGSRAAPGTGTPEERTVP